MLVLVAVLCQGCLADYYSPLTRERPTLTIDGQRCPAQTVEESFEDRTVVCSAGPRALRVSFDERGRVEAYVTLKGGERDGTSQRWDDAGKLVEEAQWRADHLHGLRRLFGADGKVTLEERWKGGEREGDYRKTANGAEVETGRFAGGARVGIWREVQPDGIVAEGAYQNGKRVGTWQLAGNKQHLSPDYTVDFGNGAGEPHAERTTFRYEKPMMYLNVALLGLAFYGHYYDKTGMAATGYIGLAVAPPLLHAALQPGDSRGRVVRDSLFVRPLSVVAVLGIYTIGKAIDGFDCRRTTDSVDGDEESHSCGDLSYDFNTKYNWGGVLVASALLVALSDVAMAHRKQAVPVERAWPQLGIVPHAGGGASMQVSGRW